MKSRQEAPHTQHSDTETLRLVPAPKGRTEHTHLCQEGQAKPKRRRWYKINLIWGSWSPGSVPLLPTGIIYWDQASPRCTELLMGLLRAGELTKEHISRRSLFHFSEILIMTTAWNLDIVLRARWSLAREHNIWNAKQLLLAKQLFSFLSINRRPENKSPKSYPPCPSHLNAHLEDSSGSFLLLLPPVSF